MADKEACPNCPAQYVWNRESRFNSGCLVLMKIVPFILMILFLVFFFVRLRYY